MARFILSAFADEAGASLSEQISALKENEIDYIEPRNIDGRSIINFSEDELIKLKTTLDENGIKVSSLGSPIGKYSIYDPFSAHLESFKKAILACKILKTSKMRIFSFYTKAEDLFKYRSEVVLRLTAMCEEARKNGISLCHENEADIYGETPEAVADLLHAIPDLNAVFDPANYRMKGADVKEGIKASFIRFGYMHVKDAEYASGKILPAGEGEGKIEEIIDMINLHTDDNVFLSVEPHLHVFDAYKDIDTRELKGKYVFKTQREAFDFAVLSLKKLLTNRGYRKDENNVWIK